MKFDLVSWEDLDEDDRQWLRQIEGHNKPDYKEMVAKIKAGEWWIFRLPKPAVGLAVGLPDEGRLFILHLRGVRLFDTVSPEDLLDAARHMGLRGMKADTTKIGVLKLLLNKGFRLTKVLDGPTYGVELDDA